MHTDTILIIGGKGKSGHRVEQRLNTMGISTRGVSRSSTIPFDWYDASTWRAAIDGTTSAYVTFQPDLAVPGAADIVQSFCDLALSVGLKKVVLLSGRGEAGAEQAEQVLIQSGLEWNVVRASWFAQNFSEGFMLDGIVSGELVLPESKVLEPFIDVDDIADVAVATLTQKSLKNRVFEVTGPRLMSFADCIDEISNAIGRPILLKPVSVDQYISYLEVQGLPEGVQWLMRELFTVVFDGRNANVENGVFDALGRQATDFSVYVNKTLDSGIWDVAQQVANH